MYPRRLSVLSACLLLAAAFLLQSCKKAEEAPAGPVRDKVVVGTEAAYPPMEFVDDAGEITGFDIELMRAIAAEADFDVEFRNLSWDALFGTLMNGDIDAIVSSVTITEERKKTMAFTDPYINSGQRLIVHKDRGGKDNRLETMDGQTIGVQIGTTGATLLEDLFPNVKVRVYENVILGFEDLSQGNLDGFFVDAPVAAYYRDRGRFENLLFVEQEYSSEQYGIVVGQENAELLARINDGLAKAKEKGIVKQLEDKWLR
ncbi:MAG: basic amino acid ABC transporter substrate-binding protein [Candidatus Sumerlaeia bacterium]|nr:basic amino acid ABC transporter substrate-binding protein [Candidatus Sumerlaeia bacterium]